MRKGNVSFRIPTPVFGLGLVENTPDQNLINDVAAIADKRSALGITGHFNYSGNDGTIARFGWKAQNKSLMIFAGEAYNVEMGVTNELFPQRAGIRSELPIQSIARRRDRYIEHANLRRGVRRHFFHSIYAAAGRAGPGKLAGISSAIGNSWQAGFRQRRMQSVSYCDTYHGPFEFHRFEQGQLQPL